MRPTGRRCGILSVCKTTDEPVRCTGLCDSLSFLPQSFLYSMDLFDREDLRRLAESQSEAAISIYMPTFRVEADAQQNPTRFKNLIREARDHLRANGHKDLDIDTLLADARRRLDDSAFWRMQNEGLAVFITPDQTEFYRLPLHFDEIAIVGERFHLKPLFPLIATNNRFYLLALSLNDVRLYQGTHEAVSEIESAEIPSDIVEAIRQYEDPEASLQMHTQNRATGNGNASRSDVAFHGQGGDAEDRGRSPKQELKRFFHTIDDGVHDTLGGENVPLLLAGVSEYLPLYRDVNGYPHLIEDNIVAGNPEALHPTELHDKAWSHVEPLFQEAQTDAVERFEQLFYQDGDLASDHFHEIVPACAYSRVETLFVPIGQHRWGAFDASANTVELHESQEPSDEDLLNYAAVHAHLNGATVYALRPENMPGGRSIAATFRYRADVSAVENG